MFEDRIFCPELKEQIISAPEAASFIRSGMTVGMSGFSTGAPKLIPIEMIKPGCANNLTLIQGAGLGKLSEIAKSGAVARYVGFQWNRDMHNEINMGKIAYTDIHLGQLAEKIRNGAFGKIDYAIIECSMITENGGIVPTLSAGISNVLVEQADKVLLELNLSVPVSIGDMYDICSNTFQPIKSILGRIGTPAIACSPEKIAGIVISEESEEKLFFRDTNALYQDMAENVLELLNSEIAAGRLPRNFTLQAGVGGVANAVIRGLADGGFSDLRIYTEVLADGVLDFITRGIVSKAATTSLDLSPLGIKTLFSNIDFYKNHIVIRPLEMSNGSSQISSMGLVALNTALEVDIYGNINSSTAMGSKMLNGIGGSNDFCRNAKLSIFITPSTAKGGNISSIVPMVSHVDNTEHDVDIIVTENGYADLRGKSPKERAKEIIGRCAHPDYRSDLLNYFTDALSICGNCQTPHDLSKALSWQQKYLETGSMN